MKQFTDALLGKIDKVKKHHHHHHHHQTEEGKDGSTSAKKHHRKSKETKESKNNHNITSNNNDRQTPPTTVPLVVAAQPTSVATEPVIAAAVVADQTPAVPSTPAKVGSPLVTEHSIVELLHEPNPKIASHAQEIIEKRKSAELIFSGVGTDAHGLHGRQAPLHSMKVTQNGIHYLTTDEAVAVMDQQEESKQAKSKDIVPTRFEEEPLGKVVKSTPKQEEDEPLGKVAKRRTKI